jgi:hypothetical protein
MFRYKELASRWTNDPGVALWINGTYNSSNVLNIMPCSPVKVNRRFGRTYRLYLQSRSLIQARNRMKQFHKIFLLRASFWFLIWLILSTLKMQAIRFSEMSVDSQRNKRRCVWEDGNLHNHRCENLKFNSETWLLNLWSRLIWLRIVTSEGFGISVVGHPGCVMVWSCTCSVTW